MIDLEKLCSGVADMWGCGCCSAGITAEGVNEILEAVGVAERVKWCECKGDYRANCTKCVCGVTLVDS